MKLLDVDNLVPLKCKFCLIIMDIVDKDPDLGIMWECPKCHAQYLRVGPGNRFDRTGWIRKW